MKQRALITGITGMVGSHLADLLLANTDWDISGLCRWRSPLDNVAHLLDRTNKKDRLFFIDGDLCDLISLQNAVNGSKLDYVFHLAAQSYPKTSFTSPIQTLDTNILGTLRLLEALKGCKDIDPVIHVCSSSEVFGRFHAEAYGQKVLITRMFTHTGPRRGDVFAESTFAKQIAMIEQGLIPLRSRPGIWNR
jgi:GDPmannose 4,6-dehydratase